MVIPTRWLYGIALTCFFLSGASGLIYEVVWTHMLGQMFGNTTHAVATVLAAFMAGLAVGSYVFGRIVDRGKNELRLYGLLEAAVGIYGLMVPWLFTLGLRVYNPLFGLNENYPSIFNLCLFLLAFALLAIPALLMGATLPVLSRFFVRQLDQVGERVGDLYAVNTLGAVLGTGLAGYYLMPTLGMRATVYVAAGSNLLIALVVMVGDRFRARGRVAVGEAVTAGDPPGGEHRSSGSWLGLLVLASFALSGFSALLYENSWSRALTLVIGTSAYSFTTMLLTFLVGLAIGGFIYARLLSHRPAPLSLFGAVELVIGLSALASIPLFEKLPLVFIRLIAMFGDAFSLFLTGQLLLSALVMFLPTVLMGATFPLVVRLFTQDLFQVGSRVGTAYAANTVGAILGAFTGGFIFIPWIGVQNTIVLAAAVNMTVGWSLVVADTRLRPAFRYAAAAVVPLALLLIPVKLPTWDPAILTSGVTIYHRVYQKLPVDSLRLEKMRRDRVVYYREGPTATVSVHENPPASLLQMAIGIPERSFTVRTNGKIDGSHNDALTQLLIGYIPLMLRPDALHAAVIGLGTGMTAKAVAAFPVRTLDILEIEPAMVEAARYFSDANGQVLSDPRVRVVLTDARNYLLATQHRYDVITSEPSNPWIAGIANLYTVDFYRRVQTKLRANGIFAQWFHDYSMSPDDFRMVLRTFAEAFPHVSVWELHRKDFLLVGSRAPQGLDISRLRQTVAAREDIDRDLGRLGLTDVYALLGFYRMGEKEVKAFSAGAGLNTDDGVQLEYSAPRNLLADTSDLNRRLLEPFIRAAPWTDSAISGLSPSRRHFHLAQGLNASGLYRKALSEVEEALRLDGTNAAYLVEKARILLRLNRSGPALRAALEALDRSDESVEPVLRITAAFEFPQARSMLYRKMTELGSRDIRTHTGLGQVAMLRGSFQDAETWLDKARSIKPDNPVVLESRGILRLAQGQVQRARVLLERARAAGRDSVLLHGALGDVYSALRFWEPAIESYEKALRYDVQNTDWRRSLGVALARVGRRDEARQKFEEVLALNASDAAAWSELQRLNVDP